MESQAEERMLDSMGNYLVLALEYFSDDTKF